MDILAAGLETLPLALPHGLESVPGLNDGLVSRLGAKVQVMHGLAIVLADLGMAVWKTGRAPVVKTTVEFVDGACGGIVAVYAHGLAGDQERQFAFVFGMLNVIFFQKRMRVVRIGLGHQVMVLPLVGGDGSMSGLSFHVLLPIEPSHGGPGIRFAFVMPASNGFRGNGAWRQTMFSKETITRRGDGHTMFERVKPRQLFKFGGKCLATFFKEANITLAVTK